jgi:selenocysteine-specific elongation factor
MYVVATAGHVDHGKSTLVRALTGMEPDRWAEERRRGLTIDLGFAWTSLSDGEQIAFVDVPGHERFVTNMLAGLGPAPAVMLVVAADEGWKPQSEEHLQAVAALGTARLLLVVTKADLAEPGEALAGARSRITSAGLAATGEVVVSAASGLGMDDLRRALDDLVDTIPVADVDAPVRLWVDRSFSIRGAGTVVTGTLAGGALRVGDELSLLPANRRVTIRGLQSLNAAHERVQATARVAVNLRGVDRDEVERGMTLVTPDAWTSAAEIDVLTEPSGLPASVVVHLGAAAVPATLRPLGTRAARLRLSRPLPLHYGDRILLRDPAARTLRAAEVADLYPRQHRRRGDARGFGDALRIPVAADDEISRRRICTEQELRTAGLPTQAGTSVAVAEWRVEPRHWDDLRAQLHAATSDPGLNAGIPLPALRRQLDLPDDRLVMALVGELPDRVCIEGRVRPAESTPVDLPGIDILVKRLADAPLAAPESLELAGLGLGPAELAHAVRAGVLTRLADGVYVAAGALETALDVLATLDQPFTVSEARERLGSTRRVVVPLLELLDATRRTRRLPDGKRLLTGSSA